jgi:uncharacterized membrane protein required for colicin V production
MVIAIAVMLTFEYIFHHLIKNQASRTWLNSEIVQFFTQSSRNFKVNLDQIVSNYILIDAKSNLQQYCRTPKIAKIKIELSSVKKTENREKTAN